MKKLLIGIIIACLTFSPTYAKGGGGGGGRSGGGKSSPSSKSPSKSPSSTHTSTSHGGSILPHYVLMYILFSHHTTAEKQELAKEHGVGDLRTKVSVTSEEDCFEQSEDDKFIVAYKEDEGLCYIFNRI